MHALLMNKYSVLAVLVHKYSCSMPCKSAFQADCFQDIQKFILLQRAWLSFKSWRLSTWR
ncbi:hypothetical protein [Chlamydia trachomatis]|uniref:hypothetical protein n=1 Tax=Chlamydia trachomatis TaxID=813 RepID=UPI00059C386A|nr:hypothetical protein [Chlamydia trachomatis]AKC30393.1 hypothetical protein L2bCS78408_02235 [Chlamydia trachomatis]AKC31303.1 hypothetical protein L2bCS1908_02235 [Chlamydia trachomatis]UYF97970.1 hypothetical protein ODL24_00445 [Chlamydia trachomatis]